MVADLLDGLDPDLVDRVLLCTSELVTNAIEHVGAPSAMRASVDDLLIRVEVDDRSSVHPVAHEAAPSAIRGRGLFIVERCADRWGVDARRGGKTVWCEFGSPVASNGHRST